MDKDISRDQSNESLDKIRQDIEVISADGDVILCIEDKSQGFTQSFRCSRTLLRQNSQYFDVLLDPNKFTEGVRVEQTLSDVLQRNHDDYELSQDVLPTVFISDLPILFTKPAVLKQLLCILLALLTHGHRDWNFLRTESLERLAQLALLAERFGAQTSVRKYISNGSLSKYLRPAHRMMSEKTVRQQLLVGLLLDFQDCVKTASALLIMEGSNYWSKEYDISAAAEQPLWNILPHGIEEELQTRRQCVLDTISSIQTHFVTLYSSTDPKERQCKRGYANSKECDSFHLGEMIKFFTQKGTLRVQSVFMDQEPEVYEGDIHDLMARLKTCPPYQMDEYHTHCGVRQRLIPILDRLWPHGQVGICIKCWKSDRIEESWLESAAKVKWTPLEFTPRTWLKCPHHVTLKGMYTASERDWTIPRL